MTELCGLLNLDKSEGPTSHDMVAQVRRALGIKQVGHAGTLDPLATGVLVIGVGPATRLMSFVGAGGKEYIARLRLGLETDSEDTTGEVTREASAVEVTAQALEAAAARLRGEILQTPPMVSAVRKDGKRLYELARQGKTVEREARPVTIYSLEIEDFQPGEAAEAVLRIRCSGGVYVRTLCADIGRFLGCGGCMAALRRTAVGPFRIEDAVTLEEFLDRKEAVLLPPSAAVAQFSVAVLSPMQRERALHGNRVRVEEGQPGWDPEDETSVVRLEDGEGGLLAMANIIGRDSPGLERDIIGGDSVPRYQPFVVLARSSV